MGVRVECDWCRQAIPPGQPYVTVEFGGSVRAGAPQSEIVALSEPARVYCGADRYTDDDPAANAAARRDEWGHRDSCFRRVLAAMTGNPVGRADAGLEWRLVPVTAPRPERVLDVTVDELPVGKPVRSALKKAGLERARSVASLTQAELVAIPGISQSRANQISQALHEVGA